MTTAIFFLRGMPGNYTPPVIVSGNAPDGDVGDAYSYTFTASGGDGGPYTWSVFSGSLPAGTSLNTSTGEVSGTLTTAATYNFVIRATDSLGNVGDSPAQSVDIVDNSDPYWANVVSLNYGDSVTGDETGKIWAQSGAGTITVNSTDTQFGMPVLEWPNAASPATLTLSSGSEDDFDFGGGDWTIEARIKINGAGVQAIFSKRPNTSTTAAVSFYLFDRKPALVATVNGTSWGVNIVSATALTDGIWYSLGVRRSGNSWEIYVDETLVASTTVAGSIPANAHAPRWSEAGAPLNSVKLAQRRITKGIARDLTIAQTAPWPNS